VELDREEQQSADGTEHPDGAAGLYHDATENSKSILSGSMAPRTKAGKVGISSSSSSDGSSGNRNVLIGLSGSVNADKLLGPDCKVHRLHGNIAQPVRQAVYREFCAASRGVLFCTDVAARGLDLPSVDWILQYDPPCDTSDYVHRAGR
jgi:hypothetical protein